MAILLGPSFTRHTWVTKHNTLQKQATVIYNIYIYTHINNTLWFQPLPPPNQKTRRPSPPPLFFSPSFSPSLQVMNEFDITECTGPFECENFARFGYTVGCENWIEGSPGNFPHQQWPLGAEPRARAGGFRGAGGWGSGR